MPQLNARRAAQPGTVVGGPFDPKHPLDTPNGLAPARPPTGPIRSSSSWREPCRPSRRPGAPRRRHASATPSSPCATAPGSRSTAATTSTARRTSWASPRRARSSIPRSTRSTASSSRRTRNWRTWAPTPDTWPTTARRSCWRWPSPTTGPGAGVRRLLEHRGPRQANYLEATQRFSAKDWRTVAWTDDQIGKQKGRHQDRPELREPGLRDAARSIRGRVASSGLEHVVPSTVIADGGGAVRRAWTAAYQARARCGVFLDLLEAQRHEHGVAAFGGERALSCARASGHRRVTLAGGGAVTLVRRRRRRHVRPHPPVDPPASPRCAAASGATSPPRSATI